MFLFGVFEERLEYFDYFHVYCFWRVAEIPWMEPDVQRGPILDCDVDNFVQKDRVGAFSQIEPRMYVI